MTIPGLGDDDTTRSIYIEGQVIGPIPKTESERTGDALADHIPLPADSVLIRAPSELGLPEGRISLIEWSQIISEFIQALRDELNEADLIDSDLTRKFRGSSLKEVVGLVNDFNSIVSLVETWNSLLKVTELQETFQFLAVSTVAFNNQVTTFASLDQNQIVAVNAAIATLNDEALLQDLINNTFGGDEVAARDSLKQQIQDYNDHIETTTQSIEDFAVPQLADLAAATDQYIALVQEVEAARDQVNLERFVLGLPLLNTDPIPKPDPISADLDDYLTYRGDLAVIPLERTPPSFVQNGILVAYTDPVSTDRTEALRQALKNQASNPTEEMWVDDAITAAQAGGPYASEGEFFIAVRDELIVLAGAPLANTMFNLALQEIPILLVSTPLPTTPDNRLSVFKREVTPERTTLLTDAMKALVTGGPAETDIDDAFSEAQAEGPFVTEGEFFDRVKTKYAAKFVDPNDGIAIFNQALITVVVIDQVPLFDIINDVAFVTEPPFPFGAPLADIQEAVDALWTTGANSIYEAVAILNSQLSLAQEAIDDEKAFYQLFGLHILLPAPIVESLSRALQEDISTIGSGIGLASFAIGLHTRNLEVALSHGILKSISTNFRIPITARLFARAQFTAMDLLFRSSLLSPVPTIRFIASRLGSLGAGTPAITVPLAISFLEQVTQVVSSGILRSQVNALINRLPFFIRVEAREQTRLFQTLGLLSVGGMASFTKAVSATLSLSILSVALANLGRKIGMPNLVAQFFAVGSSLPTIDLLVAMTAGSRLQDFLDNPISVMFLKQTLSDLLVFQRGFNSFSAGLLINSAVNNIVLRGGFETFSELRSQLYSEFISGKASPLEAAILANRAQEVIKADLGIPFLNVAFGINIEDSKSVVENLMKQDIGLPGAMLQSTVNRSLLHGGYGSRVRLENELKESYQGLGLSRQDAEVIATQTAEFIEMLGVLVPWNTMPGITGLLLGEPLLRAVAFGNPIVRQEIVQGLTDQGLSVFQADFIADQYLSLAARTFTRPGNLFELALNHALNRSLTDSVFSTQREFRDSLRNELVGVGFAFNDAIFLANSAAAFALNGTVLPIFGASPARLAAIEEAATNRIISDFGVERGVASAIVSEARRSAILGALFSSEDQLRLVLRENLHQQVISRLGRFDGYTVLDRAIADLADPGTLLGLAGLTEQLSAQILGVLRPDLGLRLAEEVKNRLLNVLLGGISVDEIEENKNPLSVKNLVGDAVKTLTDLEEEAQKRRIIRDLVQLIESLNAPNAAVGYMLQSLMDNPSTFIGSLLVEKPKGEFLDIPI